MFENDSQGRSEPPRASPISFSALRREVVFFIIRLNEWAKNRNLFGFKHHRWQAQPSRHGSPRGVCSGKGVEYQFKSEAEISLKKGGVIKKWSLRCNAFLSFALPVYSKLLGKTETQPTQQPDQQVNEGRYGVAWLVKRRGDMKVVINHIKAPQARQVVSQ